ncbi:unnamed protein product [Paramecium sonneborni]|uniref:Uncharacterized protein n=1 Tax=Paramecium sonneborni TaxID=65129 RepID=A0A8S1Q5J9_9CILI|nr:unnamed protein product [Paramecium sonneborni]
MREYAKIIKVNDEEIYILMKRQQDEKFNLEKEKTLYVLELTGYFKYQFKNQKKLKRILIKENRKSHIAIVKVNLQKQGNNRTKKRIRQNKLNQEIIIINNIMKQ